MKQNKAYSPDPVQRLLNLVEEALSADDVQVWRMWCTVLGLKIEDPVEFLPFYQGLLELSHSAAYKIQSIEDIDSALFLEWVEPVQSIFRFSTLLGRWGNVRKVLTPTVMQSMKFSAHESVRHPSGEEVIPKTSLAELRKEIEKLQAQVIEGDLAPDLKDLLSVQLESIRQALTAYQIRGAIALEEALERAAGACVLHWQLVEPSKRKESQAFRSILAQLHTLLDSAWKVKKLADPLLKLLGSGEGA